MEWFFGFKKIFNKKIALPPNQTNDLVVFYKLKNNMLKINSKAEVSDGYNLVTVHYNKVCDVLPLGDYELNGATVPGLLKFCQKQSTKKGDFIPTSVFADIYFVNVSKNAKYDFLTPNYIKTLGQQGKVKIRLQGSFNMQVVNVKRFMQSFCDSYAVVKNKFIEKDLSYYVGRVAEKAFDKTGLVLSDFLGCKDKIVDIIIQNIAQLEKDLGIRITNIFVENVLVPRRYRISKGFLQDSKNATDNSEYLLKMVENRLNNLQDDMSVVFADSKKADEKEFVAEKNCQTSNNNLSQNAQNQQEKREESIFIEPENTTNFDENKQSFSNFGDQQAPNIIAEEREIFSDENIKNEEKVQSADHFHTDEKQDVKEKIIQNNEGTTPLNQEKLVEKKSSLVACPCCGAQNFEGAEFCCVCKSKL